MKGDLISIIISTLNEAKNIKQCLLSCQKQTYKNIEIIVVDNFSKDKTTRIARKYTNKCYLSGDERSSQRNFGAKKAKGEYLLFLDADMRLTKDCLTEAIDKIKKGNTIIAFPEISKGKNFWEKSISLERSLYQKEKLLAAARLFPKKLFVKLQGFDQKLIAGEDWDLTIRAHKFGYEPVFTDSFLNHRENVKNLKEILKKKAYYSKNISLYAQKHPKEFAQQSSISTRFGIYAKNLPRLLMDPIHTAGFFFLKTLIWYDWQNIRNENKHS